MANQPNKKKLTEGAKARVLYSEVDGPDLGSEVTVEGIDQGLGFARVRDQWGDYYNVDLIDLEAL